MIDLVLFLNLLADGYGENFPADAPLLHTCLSVAQGQVVVGGHHLKFLWALARLEMASCTVYALFESIWILEFLDAGEFPGSFILTNILPPHP